MERAKHQECERCLLLTDRTCFGTQGPSRTQVSRFPPESVFSTDLLLFGERHECQWLHGLILQNSSKLLILHVLWDLKIDAEDQNRT